MWTDAAKIAWRGYCSLWDFFKIMWPQVIPEKLTPAKHIPAICAELEPAITRLKNRQEKLHDFVINIPPGMSKSTTDAMLVAWSWLHDPSLVHIIASNKMNASTKKAKMIQDLIKSETFQTFFQPIMFFLHGKFLELTSTNVTKFANNFQGVVMCASTNSEVIGEHAHMVHLDDPMSVRMSLSPAYREQVNRFVFEALSTRVKDAKVSVFVLIMQRLHELDTTAVALKKWRRIKHICLPATTSKDVKPEHFKRIYDKNGYLEPVRLGKQALADHRKRMDAYSFSGQMMQKPAPDDGVMVKAEWLDFTTRQKYEDLRKGGARMYVVIDGAYGLSDGDPTGVDVFLKGEKAIWLDSKDYDLEMPELLEEVRRLLSVWGFLPSDVVMIEPKASGHSLAQVLSANLPDIFKSCVTLIQGDGKKNMVSMSKKQRVRYIQPALVSGKVTVLEGVDWWKSVSKQLTTFPLAAHDEHIDTLCYFVGLTFISEWGETLISKWQSIDNFNTRAAENVRIKTEGVELFMSFARGAVLISGTSNTSGALTLSDGTESGAGVVQVKKTPPWDEVKSWLAGREIGLPVDGMQQLKQLTKIGEDRGLFKAVAIGVKFAKRRGY